MNLIFRSPLSVVGGGASKTVPVLNPSPSLPSGGSLTLDFIGFPYTVPVTSISPSKFGLLAGDSPSDADAESEVVSDESPPELANDFGLSLQHPPGLPQDTVELLRT